MTNYGISLNPNRCCLLQPPTGRTPGCLYLVLDDQNVWKLELNDPVITPHRTSLPASAPAPKDKTTSPSVASLNFDFVSEHIRSAIDSNSFALTEVNHPSVEIKYTINGVQCEGTLTGFSPCSPAELVKTVSKELHKTYGKLSDIQDLATSRGIELNIETTTNDIAMVEKIQQAELRRKNLSTVNPTIRAKKVTKGFGSK